MLNKGPLSPSMHGGNFTYSQLSLRRTPSGPASAVCLREVWFTLWSRSALACQYSFKGNSLAGKWLSERIAKERKIVEDALARNQEIKTQWQQEEAARE